MNPFHPRVTTTTLKGKRLFGVTISRRVAIGIKRNVNIV
jgi:hypothetical protein